jgi:hypothetical protein
MHELSHQRADRAARGDDRSFGAEWPTGADGDGCGQWLEHHDARRDAALAVEYALHHLGDAVSANGG